MFLEAIFVARKIIAFILIALIIGGIFLIGNKKTLHCDGCDKPIKVSRKSEMQEDWVIYCKECNNSMSSKLPEEED